MRGLSGWILLNLFCAASCAASLPFGKLGRPFQPGTNIVLCWKASTNNLPVNLWTYHVLPSEFSPTVISNLVALGSFTPENRDRAPALNPLFNHSDRISYRTPDAARELSILPNLGWIYYADWKAINRHNGKGVPGSERKTLKLAMAYLKKFGIDRSELVTKPNSSDLQVSYIQGTLTTYKTNKTQTAFIDRRGVMIARAVDGIGFWGKGVRDGFSMEFGNDAKISQLQILWRKLQHDKFYPIAKPDVILKSIRDGKTTWDDAVAEGHDWSSVKTMTVNKVTPYYFGESQDVVQDRVRPFALLETTIVTSQTNLTVDLYCPIIDETKQ